MKILTPEEVASVQFEGSSRRTKSACATELYNLADTMEAGQMVLIPAEDWTNKTFPSIDKKHAGNRVFTMRTLAGRTGWALIRVS